MNYQTLAEGIYYLPRFIGEPDETLAEVLGAVAFTQREARLYGKLRRVPRLEAWFGPHAYSFGGGSFPARELPDVLQALAIAAELAIDDGRGEPQPHGWIKHPRFVSCLVNFYRDGSDSVAWHADDEPELGPEPLVACISLGAPRDFLLRRKVPTPVIASASLPNSLKITLEHGSLLALQRGVQADWLHSLPKRPRCKERRVSLTFRA